MNTHNVAKQAGIHKDTLLRWLRAGLVPEPGRDRRGWREFTSEQAEYIVKFARGEQSKGDNLRDGRNDNYLLDNLKAIDWDFVDAKTDYLTHALHPYPAKFIPQIPNALIQELSSVGDTVLDPFCGSGTTLVEALMLKRHTIGLDANPVACLISRAKTSKLSATEIETLRNLEGSLMSMAARFGSGQASLFDEHDDVLPPKSDKIGFWFDPHVITELAQIKELCMDLPTEACRTLALAAFSSIIVSVSRQDSDTRYVRRDKHIQQGDTIKRFQRALDYSVERAIEFSDLVEERFHCRVIQSDVLNPPADLTHADLVVGSPPYPNAYSYHLYHMTRMLWLDMDPFSFKKIEIGSHRKYSNRGANGATADTFKNEMKVVFGWLGRILRPQRYCCLVIGDSVLNGTVMHNNELLSEVAKSVGFQLVADIPRHLNDAKKSFNPKIGKVKHEHILILKNGESQNVGSSKPSMPNQALHPAL